MSNAQEVDHEGYYIQRLPRLAGTPPPDPSKQRRVVHLDTARERGRTLYYSESGVILSGYYVWDEINDYSGYVPLYSTPEYNRTEKVKWVRHDFLSYTEEDARQRGIEITMSKVLSDMQDLNKHIEQLQNAINVNL